MFATLILERTPTLYSPIRHHCARLPYSRYFAAVLERWSATSSLLLRLQSPEVPPGALVVSCRWKMQAIPTNGEVRVPSRSNPSGKEHHYAPDAKVVPGFPFFSDLAENPRSSLSRGRGKGIFLPSLADINWKPLSPRCSIPSFI